MAHLHRGSGDNSGQKHETSTTPLFSLAAKHTAEGGGDTGAGMQHSRLADEAPTQHHVILPQYGLLGFNIGNGHSIGADEPIMLNTNAPNSFFICGSQGSGKSYTEATMLESYLRPHDVPGKPGNPVAGVVFHYDIDSSGSVAEVAHLTSLGVKVDVLVSKSNEHVLRTVYMKELKNSKHLTVRPLELRSKDLSVERMNKLMAFSEQEGKVPLYMEVIQRILREMAIVSKGAAFSYHDFRRMLDAETVRFTREQANPMNLRLALLESFMVPNPRMSRDKSALLNLKPGTLTIIDLSDPFVDAATVCVLFDICLSLIKENAPPSGLVVALDEAHKYMTKSIAATNFTERLLTTIREQRHNGTRVIICTQEPTLSEKLLDLCSVAIVHRFTSPAWFDAIKNHLGGASSLTATKEEQKDMMNNIMGLGTGESLLFSPSSHLVVVEGKARKLEMGYLFMKTRLRVGEDGGMSKMARVEAGKASANGTNGVNGITNGVGRAGLY